MSLQVNRREMVTALAKIKPVIRVGPLEMLRRVHLLSRPDASLLTISSTDLRCSVSVEVACQGGGEALEAVVDYGRLAEACSSDWAESLTLEIGVDGRLDVAGGARTRLACFLVDDFPGIQAPPEGGEWMGMGAEVVEAIGRAAPWCGGDGEGRRFTSVQSKFVWVFATVEGEEPAMGVFGADRDGHSALCLYVPGVAPVGLGCLALGKDGARLLVGLAEEGGVFVLDGEGKHWFRGEGWWASEVKGETDGADIRRFLESPQLEGYGMRRLAVEEVARVLAAAPQGVTGGADKKRGLFKIVPVSPSGSRCYLEGAEVTWSAELAADLPAFKIYEPELLVAVLKELGRCAGADGAVEVGVFGKFNLRFEVEGRALALVSGVNL